MVKTYFSVVYSSKFLPFIHYVTHNSTNLGNIIQGNLVDNKWVALENGLVTQWSRRQKVSSRNMVNNTSTIKSPAFPYCVQLLNIFRNAINKKLDIEHSELPDNERLENGWDGSKDGTVRSKSKGFPPLAFNLLLTHSR